MRPITLIAILLLLAPQLTWAHVESVDISAMVVLDRDHASVEIRIPIRELISSEYPADSTTQPDFDQDSEAVAAKHAAAITNGLHVIYDAAALAPKLTATAVRPIVVGVTEDDVTPRPCAIYTLEFTGQSEKTPTRIELSQEFFKLPPEAGYQPTVLCAITHRQAGSAQLHSGVLGFDESLIIKYDPTIPPPATAPATTQAEQTQLEITVLPPPSRVWTVYVPFALGVGILLILAIIKTRRT